MSILLSIVLATFLITLCVWVGVLFLSFKKERLASMLLFLVALSAGALMGGAFLHLLPEASEALESEVLFGTFLISFTLFFLIEKIFHWRHCHKADCDVHSFGYMNLIGDSVHNVIDGFIIASTFMIDVHLGIVTTLAVAMHEIPQEIGDFGVLLHAGFERKKAMILNYLVALMVVVGGVVGYFAFSHVQSILPYLLPFAAGGFVYIAASDLMPEIRKEKNRAKSMGIFLVFLVGIAIMYGVKFIAH